MLTMQSKFSEFIQLCVKAGACLSGESAAPPVMEKALESMNVDLLSEGLKIYSESKSMPEMWSKWVLTKVGNELDEEVRKIFIDKITDPRTAAHIHIECKFLTDAEDKLLEDKFIKDGKHLLPTIEEELKTGKVVREKHKAK